MARVSIYCKQQRLVDILADMVRSVLAWEAEYGGSAEDNNHPDHRTGLRNQANGASIGIQCVDHRTPEIGGQQHDTDDPDSE